MTKWTKADIDALVDGLPKNPACKGRVYAGGFDPAAAHLKEDLYLAAGLTAEGEPKPEKVDVWRRDEPRHWLATGYWDGKTFVPDGAE